MHRSLDQPFAQPREVSRAASAFSASAISSNVVAALTCPVLPPLPQLLGHGLEEVLEGVAAIMADNRIRNPDTREKLLAGAAGVMEHR